MYGSYFPGHIHAFYCEYVYYDRRSKGRTGRLASRPAPGVFSRRIQNGGDVTSDYAYVAPPQAQPAGYNPNIVQYPVSQTWNPSVHTINRPLITAIVERRKTNRKVLLKKASDIYA